MNEACIYRLATLLPRRPVNGLNVEIGQPAPRCTLKLPDHWTGKGRSALRWLGSGGSPLVFGHCSACCPSASEFGVTGSGSK